MENIDVQNTVRKTREGAFGNTPEVTEVKQPVAKTVEAPAAPKQPVAKAAPVANVAAAKQQQETVAPTQEEAEAPAQPQLVKGFTVGVDQNGIARLIPFGQPNFLELVGLMRYTDSKQADILHDLAMTKEARIQSQLVKLGEDMTIVAKGVGTLLTK